MSREGLFEDLPQVEGPRPLGSGKPRMREPLRDQIELRAVDLDSVIGADHRARVIWAYVGGLDLSALEEAIEAREHGPGQAPVSPRLLLALWLYGTSEGVGSARALERLCVSHDAYRWLCGGVSVNGPRPGGLSQRPGRAAGPAVERERGGFVGGGGDRSGRGGPRRDAGSRLGRCRLVPKAQDPGPGAEESAAPGRPAEVGDARRPGGGQPAHPWQARERAARERQARVEAALAKLGEIEAERERRAKTNKAEVAKQGAPRVSSTDPEARVMKMADGGFRPAYNCQLGTVAGGQIVVGLEVETSGSDRGLLPAMIEQLERRYGRRPKRHVVDGGFNKNADTEWAAGQGVKVYGPPGQTKHKTDPYAARPKDAPGVAAWRRRMKSPHGKAVYKRRSPGECINARFRQWGLDQFTLRGADKAGAVLRWFALTNNVLQAHRLMRAAP